MSTSFASTPQEKLMTPIQFLKGVGPKVAAQLAKLGIETVRDMLFYLPRRYEDRRNLPSIGTVRAGNFVTVRGRVIGTGGKNTRGGLVLFKATVADKTGSITLVWFNQPWVARKLETYRGEIIAYGQVKEAGFAYEIHSPEYELVGEDGESSDFARIVPIYSLTEGVGNATIRRAVFHALEKYLEFVEDPLPGSFRTANNLQSLAWSLRQIHEPESLEAQASAHYRLVFEEFLVLQIALEQKRRATHAETGISFPISRLVRNGSAPERPVDNGSKNRGQHLFAKDSVGLRRGDTLWDEAKSLFPFELTKAQYRVVQEIWDDMERTYPMNRLVQGDVGSGKTAVAACAMLAAVRCGYQAAMMAPTEILAEQHFSSLKAIFEPIGIEVALLVGKQTAKKKKEVTERTKQAKAQILVGTHALIQDNVAFDSLGLVIIDEQHRFGVLQRAALRQKGLNPDVLVMTATPIPRTLTMTLYGDLDVSILDELPPGRRAIKTYWRRLEGRDKVYEQARELVQQGKQAFVVCPLISESDKMTIQAAEDLYYRLSQTVYPDLRVGLLHGQMKAKSRDEVMSQFVAKELDILVSTTVIEVGVDVPNATVMIIEDANRFGLAQLHQLRGRVGRGASQSYCILLANASNPDAETRLQILVNSNDGFLIAEEDLRIRGAGEVMGTQQSGHLKLGIADLVRDSKVLEVSRQAAQRLLDIDPQLALPEHKLLAQRTSERFSLQAIVATS